VHYKNSDEALPGSRIHANGLGVFPYITTNAEEVNQSAKQVGACHIRG
jgi:hypothetical protein